VSLASDIQRPDTTGVSAVEPSLAGDPAPPDRTAPDVRPGAYWTGLVVLATGLAVTVGVLATRVTSIVQTILLAIPLALIGIGLERVGRGTGRGSLRTVGAILLVVAVMVGEEAASGMIGGSVLYVLGLAVLVWAIVELGCLRGTLGPNRFGPDPLTVS